MDKKTGKKWFYSQGKIPVELQKGCDAIKAYRLKHTGQYILEIKIDSGMGGEVVEIDQITDVHFNYASVADSGDKEIEGTKMCRTWNGDAESVRSAIKAMDVASYADQTVITGDTLDYLSLGGILLTKRYITKRAPNVMMTLGGHELTKQMQTRLPDETSLESRYGMLLDLWPHDMFYYSREIGDKVLAVCLDNSLGKFAPETAARLKNDINVAKENKRIILLFMHEPIATWRHEGEVQALWKMDGAPQSFDFDKEAVGAVPDCDKETKDTCLLIKGNADIIKGIFCGHLHSAFYTTVAATFSDEKGVHSGEIPMLAAPGNPYLGHCGIVTRIIIS